MNREQYMKGVERLVNPVDVGTIHFIQSFNNYIPKKIQKKMVAASGKKTPYMGFVVEPYSHFLFYEIKDLDKATSLLPDGYELMKTKVFDDDEPKFYGIFGCFNAHTSGFWGMRVEFYVIAKDLETGLLSWIIVDYDTNTITYDPMNALCDPNAEGSLLTIDYTGKLYVDVENEHGRKLVYSSQVSEGYMKALDQRLWIEGNLSIAYGRERVEDDPGKFSLTFDPLEFKEALRIDREHVQIDVNEWYQDMLEDDPSECLCFPYAQHYLSDSPGHYSRTDNEEELKDKLDSLDFGQIDVFSTDAFKRSFLVGGIVSAVINTILLVLVFAT